MTGAGAAASQQSKVGSIFDRIRLAVGFLTILPILDARARSTDEVAASFGFFPLVGFALSGFLALEDYTLTNAFTPTLRSIVVIATLVILTGAVHLDGLADTADALGAGRDGPRALAIMRDSRVGTFGALALFLVLAVKIAALASLSGHTRYVALFLAPGWSRWAMVAVAQDMKYLRSEGAGTVLLRQSDYLPLVTASVLVASGTLLVRTWSGLRAAVIAIATVLIIRAWYRRWLGGVTGDLIGAAGELVETLVITTMAY